MAADAETTWVSAIHHLVASELIDAPVRPRRRTAGARPRWKEVPALSRRRHPGAADSTRGARACAIRPRGRICSNSTRVTLVVAGDVTARSDNHRCNEQRPDSALPRPAHDADRQSIGPAPRQRHPTGVADEATAISTTAAHQPGPRSASPVPRYTSFMSKLPCFLTLAIALTATSVTLAQSPDASGPSSAPTSPGLDAQQLEPRWSPRGGDPLPMTPEEWQLMKSSLERRVATAEGGLEAAEHRDDPAQTTAAEQELDESKDALEQFTERTVKRRSTAMMVPGIVITGLALPALVVAVMFSWQYNESPSAITRDDWHRPVGIACWVCVAACPAIGIPLTVVGSRKVLKLPGRREQPLPESSLVVGPGNFTLRGAF